MPDKMWEVDPETRSKLQQIQKAPGSGNEKCCDCGANSPQWASPKLSIFICLECAGTHRGLGVHISFVRSITMDAFKTGELALMAAGGNAAWQKFFNENNPLGTTFEEATTKERYGSEVAEEWKERLNAKIEGRAFDKQAFAKQRTEMLKKAAERKAASGIGSGPASRSGSPAPALAGKKAQNEAYFAKMGAENSSRPDHIPPSQGGKYAGFGSGPPPSANEPKPNIPTADEFQQDPVAALTKSFGWFSAAVTKSAKVVNESYIAPTAKTIGSTDFAAQARMAALNAGSTFQSSARNATDSFNKFVEGDNHVPSRRPGQAEPEKKDFWDSFGQDNTEPERKDFWESFGQQSAAGAVAGAAKGSLGTGAMKSSGNGPAAASKPKTKGSEEGWGDEW